jgi:hypothetical protein
MHCPWLRNKRWHLEGDSNDYVVSYYIMTLVQSVNIFERQTNCYEGDIPP